MENENKYFVIQYPLGEVDLTTLKDLYDSFVEQIRNMFGTGNKVIMIPNTFQFLSLTQEQLQQIMSNIIFIMEQSNDLNSEAGARTEDSGTEV